MCPSCLADPGKPPVIRAGSLESHLPVLPCVSSFNTKAVPSRYQADLSPPCSSPRERPGLPALPHSLREFRVEEACFPTR